MTSKKARNRKYNETRFKKNALQRGLTEENYRLGMLAKKRGDKHYSVKTKDACPCGCQIFITHTRKCLECKKREVSEKSKELWSKIKNN